ncbi:AsnC family protein [Galbitalea soli]|uniref:AsnC family protein n=1 Tax=Galbitalea soli TaxID=1268042 RepID=UPI00184958EE|nr:hypothetical protein [Galbitalea soli]
MAQAHDLREGAVLDDIDRRILAALADDARLSNAQLAAAVGIAQSTAWGRAKCPPGCFANTGAVLAGPVVMARGSRAISSH